VFVEGGGLELVTGCMQGLLGSVGPSAPAAPSSSAAGAAGEGVLLGCLCQLLVPAVGGSRRAQDQVRRGVWVVMGGRSGGYVWVGELPCLGL
jgi:hypothetical protein